jgi:hypothetical protein
VTVTIRPSDGSLAAVVDVIVIACRSATVIPGRSTAPSWDSPATPARAGAQITAPPQMAATSANPIDRPRPNIVTSRFALVSHPPGSERLSVPKVPAGTLPKCKQRLRRQGG